MSVVTYVSVYLIAAGDADGPVAVCVWVYESASVFVCGVRCVVVWCVGSSWVVLGGNVLTVDDVDVRVKCVDCSIPGIASCDPADEPASIDCGPMYISTGSSCVFGDIACCRTD